MIFPAALSRMEFSPLLLVGNALRALSRKVIRGPCRMTHAPIENDEQLPTRSSLSFTRASPIEWWVTVYGFEWPRSIRGAAVRAMVGRDSEPRFLNYICYSLFRFENVASPNSQKKKSASTHAK